jgi:hypothetical protein
MAVRTVLRFISHSFHQSSLWFSGSRSFLPTKAICASQLIQFDCVLFTSKCSLRPEFQEAGDAEGPSLFRCSREFRASRADKWRGLAISKAKIE